MASHPSYCSAFCSLVLMVALCMLCLSGISQSPRPESTLSVSDSLVDVGKPFTVTLTVKHPENTVVIFPDSANEFSPFELFHSEALPTTTESGISTDVGIYQLYTWAIETQQEIRLPFLIVLDGDTTLMESPVAKFSVRELIPQVTDSTQLKLLKNIQPIAEPFNWRAFSFFACLFLLLVILGIILLRKPLLRWLRRRIVEREWQPIRAKLDSLPGLIGNQSEFIRELNRVWKQYIDRRREAAFTSLTTSELRNAIQSFEMLRPGDRELLARSSQAADFILFVDIRMTDEELNKLFTEVRGIMEREYKRRKEAAEA